MDFSKKQELALDLNASVWISAVAGGGKTSLLINRIIKLLLSGVDPQKITVITYTNEAINEIKKRTDRRIESWREDKQNLLNDLSFFRLNPSKADEILKTYKDCNFKMQVSTFHSFCFNIVCKFDDILKVNKSKINILSQAQIETIISECIGDYFASNTCTFNMFYIKQIIYEVLDKFNNDNFYVSREATAWPLSLPESQTILTSPNAQQAILEKLQNFLDLTFNNLDELFENSLCADRLKILYEELLKFDLKNKCIKNLLDMIKKIMTHNDKPTEKLFFDYIDVFFTKQFEIRKNLLKLFDLQNVSRETNQEDQKFSISKSRFQIILDECDLLLEYIDHYNRLKNFDNSRELIFIVSIIVQKYQAFKKENNFLDYSDIINKCLYLIKDSENSQSALWDIFNNCQYFILDEAQDISQKQWEIIKIITEEFFSGQYSYNNIYPEPKDGEQSIDCFSGRDNGQPVVCLSTNNNGQPVVSRETILLLSNHEKESQKLFSRTIAPHIFIVGDPKQSIFSFQGSDPNMFFYMKNFFLKAALDVNMPFHDIEWNFSFRLPVQICDYVDNYFNSKGYAKDLSCNTQNNIVHKSLSKNENGEVFNFKFDGPDCKSNVSRETTGCPLSLGESQTTGCPLSLGESQTTAWPLSLGESQTTAWPLSLPESQTIIQKIINTIIDIGNKNIESSCSVLILVRSRNELKNLLVQKLKLLNINLTYKSKFLLKEHDNYKNLILLLEFFLNDLNQAKLLEIIIRKCINLSSLTFENQPTKLFDFPATTMIRQSFEVKSDSSNCDSENIKQDSNYNDWLNLFFTNVPLFKAYINNNDYKNFFILLQKLISDGVINFDQDFILKIESIFDDLCAIGLRSLLEILLNIKQNDYEIECDEVWPKLNKIVWLSPNDNWQPVVSRETIILDESQALNSVNNLNVKIMTIHSSKGLEADHVIFYDDFSEANKIYRNATYYNDMHNLFCYFHKEQPIKLKALKKILSEGGSLEEKRLLYVAMTRAKKGLYIIR